MIASRRSCCAIVVTILTIAICGNIAAFASEHRGIASYHDIWRDSDTGRGVPVVVWHPATAEAPCPVVIYSHGLGGASDDFGYLGRAWAKAGIITVVLEHVGSDEDAWRGRLMPMRALRDVYERCRSGKDRVRDILIAVDYLHRNAAAEQEKSAWKLPVEPDLDAIGVAGNDLGALAAMILAGQRTFSGGDMRDARVKAIAALGPPVPGDDGSHADRYGSIETPCLFIAGTRDDGVVGPTQAWQRRIPFDNASDVDAYLLMLHGGDHMVYGGHVRRRRSANDGMYQRLIADASTTFWLAHLSGQEEHRKRLEEGDATITRHIAWVESRRATVVTTLASHEVGDCPPILSAVDYETSVDDSAAAEEDARMGMPPLDGTADLNTTPPSD